MLQSKELDLTYQLNNNKDVLTTGLHKESWQEELCSFFRVQRRIFMTEISFLEHSLSKMKHIKHTKQNHVKFSFISKGKFSNHGLMLKFSNI